MRAKSGLTFFVLLGSLWHVSGFAQINLLRLQGEPSINGDLFGAKVAQAGDLMVVTALQNERDPDLPRNGAAFVYSLDNTGGLTQIGLLSPNDVASGDENQFGTATAISFDLIAVGDSFARSTSGTFDDNGGAVYIFRRSGNSFSQVARLSEAVAPMVSSSDQLGWSVDMSGGLVVAGGLGGENPDGDTVGIVRVYRDLGNAGWNKISDLQPVFDEKDLFPSFGWSVSISPGFIAVGAPGADRVGAVFVYPITGNQIGPPTKIPARIGARSFGSSVAAFPTVRGPGLIIGASGSSLFSTPGAAYYFEFINGSWQFRQNLTQLFVTPNDGFGSAVRALGDCVVISAPGKTRVGQASAGEAYLWKYSFGAFGFVQALISPPETNAFFGASLSLTTRGIIVGAPGEGRLQNGTRPRGAVYYDSSFNQCFDLPGVGDFIFRNGFESI